MTKLSIPAAITAAQQLFQAGRMAEVQAICHLVLQAAPEEPGALDLLGLLAYDAGDLAQAETLLRRAIAGAPEYGEYHDHLGVVLGRLKRFEEAVAAQRRALELQPLNWGAFNNLATSLMELGRTAEAEAASRLALELRPHYAQAYVNLGNALCARAQLVEAEAAYRRALELQPANPQCEIQLGITLEKQWRLAEAEAAFRRAIAADPGRVTAHVNLAFALISQGRMQEAEGACRQALAIDPGSSDAHTNLGTALQSQGRLDEARAAYQRALELKPDFAAVHSGILVCEQYRPGVTPAALAAAHAEWDRRHAAPLARFWRPHLNTPDARRRLRLGFVSADFGRHPVGYFLVRVLESLDRSQCETFCYSDRAFGDDLAPRLRAAAGNWRETAPLSDAALDELIRADAVDILFDLAGHTVHNRMLLFARKPAPLQITWIGYVGTTGLRAMDYLLADRYQVPPGAEPYYREQVLRMPDGYVCFDPPITAPEVGPLPAAQCGQVTFGSFNNLAKITPPVVEVWSEILRRLPQSRLLLKYGGGDDESTRGRYRQAFARQGIAPERIEMLGQTFHAEHLAGYGRVDVALDPFPYGGGLTTCEALWMGVPVITCPGENFASRHSLSHLSIVGLTETIAADLPQYVELALALAADLPRLAALRGTLRARMAASPLCDGPRFAGNLLELLRSVWRQWTTAAVAAGQRGHDRRGGP